MQLTVYALVVHTNPIIVLLYLVYMWHRAHEAWKLDDPPELVTFAKKMQLGGYYHTNDCKPRHAYRIFNTWMGDPARLALAEVIVKEIKGNNLVKNAGEVGDVLLGGLKDLQV